MCVCVCVRVWVHVCVVLFYLCTICFCVWSVCVVFCFNCLSFCLSPLLSHFLFSSFLSLTHLFSFLNSVLFSFFSFLHFVVFQDDMMRWFSCAYSVLCKIHVICQCEIAFNSILCTYGVEQKKASCSVPDKR